MFYIPLVLFTYNIQNKTKDKEITHLNSTSFRNWKVILERKNAFYVILKRCLYILPYFKV